MKKRAQKVAFDHSGSSFDSLLEEEGIREEVEAVAIKRVLAWQLSQEMQQQKKTKQAMARDLQTSRSQLDRLLDPRNVSVSLDTMARAARVLGKSLEIRIRDRMPGSVKHRGATSRSKEQPAKRGRKSCNGNAAAACIHPDGPFRKSPGA
jgi:plasmid maintenance system antidote protein VapI